MKHLVLFILIQCASAGLFVPGLPVCAYLAYTHQATYDKATGRYHWPAWAWIWDNDEDGVVPTWYRAEHPDWSFEKAAFRWSALRNSVNNLRYVRGVSGPGRPLLYRTWTWNIPSIAWREWGVLSYPDSVSLEKRQFYWKAGWQPNTGWPVISAGGGTGFGATAPLVKPSEPYASLAFDQEHWPSPD
jgi:hypothetical protein